MVGAAWALQDVSECEMVQDHNGCCEMIWKTLKVADDLKTGVDGGIDDDGEAEMQTLLTEPLV